MVISTVCKTHVSYQIMVRIFALNMNFYSLNKTFQISAQLEANQQKLLL